MKINGISKDGNEIEIEETEVIKIIKEEYEKKEQEYKKEIVTLKEKCEEEKNALRNEHIKQVRAILMGRNENTEEQEEFDENEEEKEFNVLLKKTKEQYKKMI